MSAILVTGASGAIGRHVVAELADRGERVVTFSRGGGPDHPAAVHRRGDIRRLEEIEAAVADHGVTRIVHIAALLLDSETDPFAAFAINTMGMAAICEAARRRGVARIVYASTKAAFGPLIGPFGHPEYRPVEEDHPLEPTTTYGFSKKLAEEIGTHYRRRFGLEVVSIRFGTTTGPGRGSRHGASQVTSRMIENAVAGLPTVVPQGGDERDDIIYTRDVAHGLVLAAIAPTLSHHTYHLGSGALIGLDDIAAAIRAEIPEAAIEIGPGLDYMGIGIGNYCLMSTARAAEDLGFAPRYDLAGWVRDFIAISRAGKS